MQRNAEIVLNKINWQGAIPAFEKRENNKKRGEEMQRKCLNCGAPVGDHPRRLYCAKKECQRKRLNENQKKYQKKIRELGLNENKS
jgi:uncharacterized OB-fold protein